MSRGRLGTWGAGLDEGQFACALAELGTAPSLLLYSDADLDARFEVVPVRLEPYSPAGLPWEPWPLPGFPPARWRSAARLAAKNNLTMKLLDLVRWRRDLVSTNGDKFGHPDVEAIAKTIRFDGQSPEIDSNDTHTKKDFGGAAGMRRRTNDARSRSRAATGGCPL